MHVQQDADRRARSGDIRARRRHSAQAADIAVNTRPQRPGHAPQPRSTRPTTRRSSKTRSSSTSPGTACTRSHRHAAADDHRAGEDQRLHPDDADPATATRRRRLKIVIDAGNVDDGLVIEADGVEVQGLDIQRALREGVHIEGSDNTIAGNYIGTGVNGDGGPANDLEAVRVLRGDGNLIGGPDAADRNVISSNGFADVLVESGTGNTVQNNHIGTDVDGTTDLADGRGVQIRPRATSSATTSSRVRAPASRSTATTTSCRATGSAPTQTGAPRCRTLSASGLRRRQ